MIAAECIHAHIAGLRWVEIARQHWIELGSPGRLFVENDEGDVATGEAVHTEDGHVGVLIRCALPPGRVRVRAPRAA